MFKNILPEKILTRLNEDIIFLQDEEINTNMAISLSEILSKRKDYFLDLSSNVLGKDGGIAIAKLNAKGLGLAKSFITDDAVKIILTNQSLMCLNLRGNEITDDAFCHEDLSKLVHLEALDLSQTKITSTTCDALAKLPSLKLLVIDYNEQLSKEAIQKLMTIPSLCYIQAEGCGLDDATKSAIKKFNIQNQSKTAEVIPRLPIMTLSSPDFVVGEIAEKKKGSGCEIQ